MEKEVTLERGRQLVVTLTSFTNHCGISWERTHKEKRYLLRLTSGTVHIESREQATNTCGGWLKLILADARQLCCNFPDGDVRFMFLLNAIERNDELHQRLTEQVALWRDAELHA